MTLVTEPGLLTVLQDPYSLPALATHGYKWVSFQAQNDTQVHDYDLAPAKAAGLSPGVWGVTYSRSSFFRDGQLLGEQAVKLGAEHVQMDVEEAAKDTRMDRGMRLIVNGLRGGGWSGPVTLNTMGAPDNPDVNDYRVDVQSFLDTGGGVISQDYFNESDTFRPSLGRSYWVGRMGVPADRFNSMIGLHVSASDKRKPNVRVSGAEWAALLREAGIRRNFSIFMAEHCTEADLIWLDSLTKAVLPSASDTRMRMIADAKAVEAEWVRLGWTQAKIDNQRITLARALLEQVQNTTWPAKRDELKRILLGGT